MKPSFRRGPSRESQRISGEKNYWSEREAHQKVGQRYRPRPDIILIFPLIFFLTRAMDFVEKERLHVVLMHG